MLAEWIQVQFLHIISAHGALGSVCKLNDWVVIMSCLLSFSNQKPCFLCLLWLQPCAFFCRIVIVLVLMRRTTVNDLVAIECRLHGQLSTWWMWSPVLTRWMQRKNSSPSLIVSVSLFSCVTYLLAGSNKVVVIIHYSSLVVLEVVRSGFVYDDIFSIILC